MDGWIKLHRKLMESETFSYLNAIQKLIAIYIILNANHKDGIWIDKYRNIEVPIKRGQLITSRQKIKKEWFDNDKEITDRKIRTTLEKLEKLNFLTKETTNSYTLITVLNYDIYQTKEINSDQQIDQQTTSRRPADDQQTTLNKNVKNVKNDKNEEEESNKDLVGDSKESPSTSEPPRYDIDSVYYQAALYLRTKILNFNSKCKVPKDNPNSMDKWSNDIRLILERDKRTKKELATIIDYIFDVDDFWKGQIQSPSGLRKHWDKIQGKMLSNQNRSQGQKKVINFQEQIDRMADW